MSEPNQAFITRIASVLPNEPVGSDAMEDVLGCVGGERSRARRIVLRSNGIRTRHYVLDPVSGEPRQTNAQLAAEAVRALDADEIDCLACGTSLPDQLMPNHAVMVHGELGIPACEVVATAGICLSGTTALKYAWMAVRSGEARHAVASASEVASMMMRGRNFEAEREARVAELEAHPELAFEKDFLRWMLSDGAGAVMIESSPREGQLNLRLDWIELSSQAHELPVCMYAGGDKDEGGNFRGWLDFPAAERAAHSLLAVKQDVRLLNANVVEYTLRRPLEAIIERRGLAVDAIDWFLPHMSSEYFRPGIEAALASLDFAIAGERWFTNLAECGNTGSASIYIMLDQLVKSGRLARGQKILCFVPESGRFSSGFFHLTVV
ncbi:beta-ketoacyl-ACP synthase III [Niveibacterium terrae]|uniref:beta-ketoacyl-ACP synthase III n=1 Tax=Niveibacterium terrae TaxID=3373598 RepID=UPI003A9162C6